MVYIKSPKFLDIQNVCCNREFCPKMQFERSGSALFAKVCCLSVQKHRIITVILYEKVDN